MFKILIRVKFDVRIEMVFIASSTETGLHVKFFCSSLGKGSIESMGWIKKKTIFVFTKKKKKGIANISVGINNSIAIVA